MKDGSSRSWLAWNDPDRKSSISKSFYVALNTEGLKFGPPARREK
jgi:hypothetical protein